MGPGWGLGGALEERLYLCSRCGQGFPRYQQLEAHSEGHTGEGGTKCGTTPVNGATQRGNADKHPKCLGERHQQKACIIHRMYRNMQEECIDIM